MPTKIIVAGGRSFKDYDTLSQVLDEKLAEFPGQVEIVHGGASGADTLAGKYASARGIPVTVFPARWSAFGKSAGYRRNVEMAQYADSLIAFWNGESKGTRHMINIMRDRKKPFEIIEYE